MPDERSDAVVALSRWRAVLARSRNPRKRMDLLLAEPNAAALVPRLPIEDYYYLVRGVGIADAGDLLRLASPEQLQGTLDLDLWHGDRLSTSRVLGWIELLAELPPPRLARLVRTLDAELAALVVGRHARVYDPSVGEAPADDSPFVVFRTPDAAFVVELRAPTATAARLVERFILRLYDADPDLARRVLMDAKWGTAAELEEESLRWRSARLADLGFPGYDEALLVYRPVDATGLAPPAPPAAREADETRMLPVPFAEALGDETLFERALAEVEDPALLATLTSSLVGLLNRVLVADRVDPADVDEVRETTARVRDTLSLGLERLSDGDLGAATAVVARVSLVEVFRVGWSLVAPLARRARALDRAGVVEPDLDPLLAPRPLFPGGLDAEPTANDRPFRTRADVGVVEAYLADLEGRPAG